LDGSQWMIYGAYGYTGELIAEEALARGHRPILAGRSSAQLQPLAERLGLAHATIDLDDTRGLVQAVGEAGLVLNAAGPFVRTAEPAIRACLTAGAHYVDITGEIAVFQTAFAYDNLARRRRVALLPGAGFDVVPTDCLANYVVARLPEATQLELAFATVGGASPGTLKTALEGAPDGVRVRRAGTLVSAPSRQDTKLVRFSDRERYVVAIPWGDLETAYRSTGVPNITTYIATTAAGGMRARLGWSLAQRLLRRRIVRTALRRAITAFVRGPDRRTREAGRTYIWACARDSRGQKQEAWLETTEAYRFTAAASVRCVERILEARPSGALTPAQAFGADFVLEIEGTRRYDVLPGDVAQDVARRRAGEESCTDIERG